MPDNEIARLTDRLMRRIHAALNAKAAEFDTYRLGPGGGIILLTLAEIEPAKVHELVGRMARDKSQMTRAIKALEAKGLIERQDDPRDARVSVLKLTDEGGEAVGAIEAAVSDALAVILAPLSTTEKETLRGLLKRIHDV
ncbi:MAG: MarR family transcriptional regulator [Pseudomonadota bacterium]